jgi:hypothetical protein
MKNSSVIITNAATLSVSFLEFKELLQITVLLLSVVLSILQVISNKKK